MKNRILIIYFFLALSESLTIGEKKTDNDRKLNLLDVRGLVQTKETDNPLSELWDPKHIRVARQKVNMNMNVPINRLKLHLDDTYRVKIVVHNDEDFNSLYDYFYGKEEDKEEAKEDENDEEEETK
jgi:hypothetical protein